MFLLLLILSLIVNEFFAWLSITTTCVVKQNQVWPHCMARFEPINWNIKDRNDKIPDYKEKQYNIIKSRQPL